MRPRRLASLTMSSRTTAVTDTPSASAKDFTASCCWGVSCMCNTGAFGFVVLDAMLCCSHHVVVRHRRWTR